MNKTLARLYKSHYGVRWSSFKHNKKAADKVLLIEDKFIIKHAKGKVLAIDSLGEQYCGILDLDVTPNKPSYDTLLLLNCIHLKYKTINEIADKVHEHSAQLTSQGHLVLNLNFRYLKYDRLNISTNSLVNSISQLLISKGFELINNLYMPKIANFGYGELFLAFKKI